MLPRSRHHCGSSAHVRPSGIWATVWQFGDAAIYAVGLSAWTVFFRLRKMPPHYFCHSILGDTVGLAID